MTALSRRFAALTALSVAFFAALTTPSWAAKPELNGLAVHSELGQEQFIAAVYSETKATDARTLILSAENKAMEIRILADTLYARRFTRMWIEGIAINSGSRDLERHAQDLADFSNMMRIKLRAGDILRMDRDKISGTLININGFPLGTIKDPEFFDLLLRTWLGPVPLSTDFKQALLVGGAVPASLLQRFNSIQPTDERIAAIGAGLKSSEETKAPTEVAVVSSSSKSSNAAVEQPVVIQTSSAKSVKATTTKSSSSKPPIEVATAPTTGGITNEDDLFGDESIFDDEGTDYAFTAEALLSEQLYISKLTKWTGGFVKYPKFAVRNEQEGTVRLTVTLARDGKVKDVQYLEKSQYEQLNRAANKAVTSASPYPAVPEEIKGATFVFTVPVVFRLN